MEQSSSIRPQIPNSEIAKSNSLTKRKFRGGATLQEGHSPPRRHIKFYASIQLPSILYKTESGLLEFGPRFPCSSGCLDISESSHGINLGKEIFMDPPDAPATFNRKKPYNMS